MEKVLGPPRPQEAEARTSSPLGRLEAQQVRDGRAWLPEPTVGAVGSPAWRLPCMGEVGLVFRYALCGLWMREGRRLAVPGDADPILPGECG